MKKEKVTSDSLNVSRRNLPHMQVGGAWYFLTFRTAGVHLPGPARNEVIASILHEENSKYRLAAAVVMPDHVHLLLSPIQKEDKDFYGLGELLKPLKGASARRINELSGNKGSVWQEEWFDRVVRNGEEFGEKLNYIINNPVKAGLAPRAEEYRWLVVREMVF